MNSLPSFEEQKNCRLKTLEQQSSNIREYNNRYARIEEYNQQLQQFNNLVVTTEKPTYADLYIEKQNQSIGDPTLHQNGLLGTHLLEIADAENSQTLLDCLVRDLTFEQIKMLNSRWTGFLRDLKRTFEKGIDKDTFVNFVVEYLSSPMKKLTNKNVVISKIENTKDEIPNEDKVKYVRLGQKQQAVLEDIKSYISIFLSS